MGATCKHVSNIHTSLAYFPHLPSIVGWGLHLFTVPWLLFWNTLTSTAAFENTTATMRAAAVTVQLQWLDGPKTVVPKVSPLKALAELCDNWFKFMGLWPEWSSNCFHKRLHTKSSRISACRPGWRICHSSAPTTMGSSLVLSQHGMFNSSGRKPKSWFLKAEHGRHKTFQESFTVHSLNLLSGLCHQNHGGGIGMMEDSYQNQLADWTKHSF